MYIWIGIDVDDQLATVREAAKAAEARIGFAHSNFTLPLHISLKISFPTDEPEAIMETVKSIFRDTPAFDIAVKGIDNEGTIAWIRMENNQHLDGLHDRINEVLLQRHGVGLHEYDTDYKFHTTLFMDDDAVRVTAGYEAVKEISLPRTLRARRFVIGTSESGKLGSYRVTDAVEK